MVGLSRPQPQVDDISTNGTIEYMPVDPDAVSPDDIPLFDEEGEVAPEPPAYFGPPIWK